MAALVDFDFQSLLSASWIPIHREARYRTSVVASFGGKVSTFVNGQHVQDIHETRAFAIDNILTDVIAVLGYTPPTVRKAASGR